jgi:hypothetical protein
MQNPTLNTPQEMQNEGFDPTFRQPTVELLGYDSVNNVLRRVVVDVSGNLVSSASSGGTTQYTDAAVTPAHPVGTIPVFDNAGTITAVSVTKGLPVQLISSVAVAVTGTFWQATQPVSGTFWQATQPISGNVGTASASINVNQTTSNSTAVQFQSGSIASTNGILVQALSTNTASVFIGGSGVTTSNGFELQAGQAVPFTASNVNLLYVIGSNNTDKICWSVL